MLICRRLALSIFVVFLVQGVFVPGASAGPGKKPVNILLMISDDQRWDELGLVQTEQGAKARWPFLETPNLDALAAEGIRFRNAFVTSSLCSPSRSSILTGQYNHINGIIDNATSFTPRPTWATALQAAGYTTAMIGKWHHGMQANRPGFDYVASFRGQGQYHDAAFMVNGRLDKTKGYVDVRTVDFAIEFLEHHREKPFAMMVGFKAVHQPFIPMAEHAQRYTKNTIQATPNWDSVAPWNPRKHPTLLRRPNSSPVYKSILRTVDGLDKNVGRLLGALDRLNLANNTLVIFTSDNGYYLGEHRLGDKRSAYEESMRVPMIVRLPGVVKQGAVSDELVLNIDIAPTILAMANQQVPAAMQGRTLSPLLAGDSADWRKAFLYEYWEQTERASNRGFTRTPTILAVRTASDKLITYPGNGNWTELFDLRVDPYETRNLVGYRRSRDRYIRMCGLLEQMLAETGYTATNSPEQWLFGVIATRAIPRADAGLPATSYRPPLRYPAC